MKKSKSIFTILVLVLGVLISCDKEEEADKTGCTDPLSHTYDSDAVSDNGSCKYYYGGREMGQIDIGSVRDMDNEYNIYVDNEFIGRLTYYFPDGLSCGNPNAVGRVFNSGTHSIRAEGNGGTEIREGTVTLDPQECLIVLVEDLPIVGGGSNGTGNVKFWINQDFGCGQISVYVNGVGSSTITGYFSSAPNCSSDGYGGNFNNLTPGTYSYNASCSGYTWSNTFTISEGVCLRYQLTL